VSGLRYEIKNSRSVLPVMAESKAAGVSVAGIDCCSTCVTMSGREGNRLSAGRLMKNSGVEV